STACGATRAPRVTPSQVRGLSTLTGYVAWERIWWRGLAGPRGGRAPPRAAPEGRVDPRGPAGDRAAHPVGVRLHRVPGLPESRRDRADRLPAQVLQVEDPPLERCQLVLDHALALRERSAGVDRAVRRSLPRGNVARIVAVERLDLRAHAAETAI